MSNTYNPINVKLGKCLSIHKSHTIGPIPIGEEVTEDMSRPITDAPHLGHNGSLCANSPPIKTHGKPMCTCPPSQDTPVTVVDKMKLKFLHPSHTSSPSLRSFPRSSYSDSQCKRIAHCPVDTCYQRSFPQRLIKTVSVGHLACAFRSLNRSKHLPRKRSLSLDWSPSLTCENQSHSDQNSVLFYVATGSAGSDPSESCSWQAFDDNDDDNKRSEDGWSEFKRASFDEAHQTTHVHTSPMENSELKRNNEPTEPSDILLLPGSCEFEDELVREVSYLHVANYLTNEFEYLQCLPIIHDVFGCEANDFLSGKERPWSVSQSLIPDDQIDSSLSDSCAQPFSPTIDGHCAFELSLNTTVQTTFSHNALSIPNGDDQLSQNRLVTTMAADLVTGCMEQCVDNTEQMQFLKSLHQLLMQTSDIEWALPIHPADSAPLTSISDIHSAKLSRRFDPNNRDSLALSSYTSTSGSDDVILRSGPESSLTCDIQNDFFSPHRSGPSSTSSGLRIPFSMLTRPPAPKALRKSILRKQGNRCAGCGVYIETRYLKRMRFCEFFHVYCCCVCHLNTLMVLPGSVLGNWDFRMLPVSNVARDRLKQLHTQPLLRSGDFNSRVFQIAPELRNCTAIRKQGQLLLPFVRFCSGAQDLLTNLDASLPAHWLAQPSLWSVADLCAVRDGHLEIWLRGGLQPIVDHLSNCQRCRSQGFICEICHKGSILFPFGQPNTVSCPNCNACFHRKCLRQPKAETCPRCIRRVGRCKQREERAAITVDVNEPASDEEKMLS